MASGNYITMIYYVILSFNNHGFNIFVSKIRLGSFCLFSIYAISLQHQTIEGSRAYAAQVFIVAHGGPSNIAHFNFILAFCSLAVPCLIVKGSIKMKRM